MKLFNFPIEKFIRLLSQDLAAALDAGPAKLGRPVRPELEALAPRTGQRRRVHRLIAELVGSDDPDGRGGQISSYLRTFSSIFFMDFL